MSTPSYLVRARAALEAARARERSETSERSPTAMATGWLAAVAHSSPRCVTCGAPSMQWSVDGLGYCEGHWPTCGCKGCGDGHAMCAADPDPGSEICDFCVEDGGAE